jgi:DNA polymerase I
VTGGNIYKNPDRMANVQAAMKLMDLGYEFVPGMKVSWVVTDSRKVPQQVEPYIDGRAFEHEPDWEYYARRVAASLARATEVFGWQEKALLSGQRQADLFGSFDDSGGGDGDKGGGGGKGKGGRGGRKRKEGPKKNGPVNLTDFM